MPNDENGAACVVLLTGFGPFPGVAENVSGAFARRLAEAARRKFPAHRFVAATLPTEWDGAPRRLAALLGDLRPDLALHFGVSRQARGFVVETRAVNANRASADACGALPGACCVEGGADALAVTVPAYRIVAALTVGGFPAMPSRDAGGYLCNATLYRSLRHGREAGYPGRCGFVHIPVALEGAFGWTEVLTGGLVVIEACLHGGSLGARDGETGESLGERVR